MRTDRLLRLADFLDALSPKRFLYAHWVGPDWKGDPDLSCGTTACALGWATVIPEFREAGLRLVRNPEGFSAGYVEYDSNWGRAVGTQAAAEFFEIDRDLAEFLFQPSWSRAGRTSPSGRATAAEVAKHIRDCAIAWSGGYES